MGAGLSGCTYRKESYRYKLTLSLNTPDGVKTGSVVNEYGRSEVFDPLNGWINPPLHRGQALLVDMGAGRKPLIATLADRCQKRDYPFCLGEDGVGTVTWPDGLLRWRAGYRRSTDPDDFDAIPKWKAEHAHFDLVPGDLPELVTFDDINDATTLRLVDPFHPEQVLGPGISWNAMTVDIVDEPLSTGIETKLPLLVKLKEIQKQKQFGIHLDGSEFGYGMASGKASLTNHFGPYQFETSWSAGNGN